MEGVAAWAGLGSAHDAWVFALAVLVLNATPGVDLLLTLSRTWAGGVRAGLAAALGINAGCAVHALAAAFGLAALLAASAAAFTALKWAGAVFLLWLAFTHARTAWRAPKAAPAAAPSSASACERSPATAPAPAPTPAPTPAWADFRRGLLTNLFNPKVALFFLAFLPSFIGAQVPHKTLAFLVLGAWFVGQSTLFLMLVVALAAPLRRHRWPHWTPRALHGAAATLFAGLALRLGAAEPIKA